MGRAVGLKDDEVINATPVATTRTTLLAWETLTRSRPWLEGLAAKAVLEMNNLKELGNSSGNSAERWMNDLGLSSDDVEFFLLHAEVDQEHARGALDGILEYGRPADFDRCLDAVESSMMAWKVFRDGIAMAAADQASVSER
jgi:pyrroloquinoline quinone (PQQ) biosynthesis protein C